MANQPVIITRVFNATRDQVWTAWTDPEYLKKWWGPKNYTAPTIKNDMRVGGKYHYAMQAQDGQLIWSTGTYKEIRYLEKIVATDSFADDKGNIVPAAQYGMPEGMPDELLITVTFEDQGNKTKLTINHRDFPPSFVQDCTNGWNESLDKLETVLKSMQQRPELSV